ncbi:hypothetical protein K443DRAFT_674707 [Laccaria amethystina LaAM-08-1]|uniref:DUF7598 domain-containing protein n=1 Tax=Laccaria amethystina LaAM-08-1 TaxID=1095629 RepID=A0A0C9YD75_9AGAR|nr:hypothetical protein K443DRAFT_674707 [Laccaria amethystina LaAM-08-1]
MGLNAVRVLSLVSLILVFSSTIYVMVTNVKAVNYFEANKVNATDLVDCDYIDGSTVPNQPAGVFWAVVASLLIIFQTIILFLSEVSWPMSFFDRFFPVLGSEFGLGALGIFQCLISTQILSHHVDDFTLVSAFFLFAIGCLNMLLGLVFRESAKQKRSIRSWRAEAKGILPTGSDKRPVFVNATPSSISSMFSNEKAPQDSGLDYSTSWRSTDKQGYGFGRQGEKAAGLRGFILQKPEESLPRYMTPTPPLQKQASLARSASSVSSTSSFSSPYRESRQTQGFERPESPEAAVSGDYRAGTPIRFFKSSNTAL